MRKDAEREHGHEVPADLVALSTHGEVGASDAEYARGKIARVASPVSQLVQRITAELRRHPGYSPQDSVEAKAEIDLGGKILRASAEAANPRAAIDELVDKLGHQVAASTV